MATSFGRAELVRWILEQIDCRTDQNDKERGSIINLKDRESGWTCLHRAAFYGQLHSLISITNVFISNF